MTAPDPSDAPVEPFAMGRQAGREAAITHPLTETEQRHIRTLLSQAETPPAKAS